MRGSTLFVTLALLAVPAPLAGCAGAPTARERADDDVVSARVGARMAADPDVSKYQIDVDVIDGVVTLRGKVPSQMARQEAEELARNTEGVSEVRNKLTIEDLGLGERMEESANDSWIKTKVGARLTTDPDVPRWKIDVDVQDGVVTLSGTVETMNDKREAEDIARRTEGVKRVVNELQVRTTEEGTDERKGDDEPMMERDEPRGMETAPPPGPKTQRPTQPPQPTPEP
jgi:osmotically-inducible protein OsmY